MSDDLVSRATIKAQMLRMGEPVAFGSDADIIDELVKSLTEARAEIERLKASIDRVARVDNSLAKQLGKSIERNSAIASELATLRARVREVVGPFGNLAQRYDDTVSDGWIPWTEFITDHEWPSEIDCRAARQLNEDLKDA